MHTLNLILHVIAGIIAMLTGFAAIITVKGGKKHIRSGRYFLKMMVIVIATALIGVFVFERNTFLLVITLLSGYTAYSGLRVLKLHGQKPAWIDYIIPVLVLAAGIYYLYYIRSIGLYWAPVIVYSTLGALALVTIYDLSRVFIPVAILQKTMIYEHIYKVTSSLTGITSAFIGTVLPQFQPYSQILPSACGLAYIIITFICRLRRESTARNSGIYDQNSVKD